MRLICIEQESNGSHNEKVTVGDVPIPDGWAIIRSNAEFENYPFGTFEVEEVDGVAYMVEDSWIPGIMPDPAPIPDPEPESSVWDELDAAYTAGYQEGVDSV